jgi:hypothetical protein
MGSVWRRSIWGIGWLWWAGCLCVCGCHVNESCPQAPVFRDLYQRMVESQEAGTTVGLESEKTLSLAVVDMPVNELVQMLAREGTSLVVEEALDSRLVTLEVHNEKLSTIVGLVSRRIGAEVSRIGGVYYVGQLRAEDRGILVRHVGRLSAVQLKAAVEVLLSERGKVESMPDGVVVVGDRVEVLERVRTLLDELDRCRSGVWVVQLHIASVSREGLQELGLDVAPAADFAVALGSAGNKTDYRLGLDLGLRALRDERGGHMVGEPMFLLADGEQGRLHKGSQTPVPHRAVSPEGTVTTTDYQMVETGVTVEVGLREVDRESVRLTVHMELTEVSAMLDGAPVVAGQRFEAVSVVGAGVYLIGSMELQEVARSVGGVLQLSQRVQSQQGWLYLWAQVVPIR